MQDSDATSATAALHDTAAIWGIVVRFCLATSIGVGVPYLIYSLALINPDSIPGTQKWPTIEVTQ